MFRHQRGIGLVEVMIALAISLFLVGGVGSIFINLKHGFKVQETQSRLQEKVRLASIFLSTNIAKTGFLSGNTVIDANIVGIENAYAPNEALFGNNNVDTDPFDGADVLDGTDTVRVGFRGDGLIKDCLGTSVAVGVRQFSLRVNSDSQLECKVTGADPQPILGNIENMQILYGMDTDDDGSANQYVNADNAALDFDRVVSAHVSLLLVSEANVFTNVQAKRDAAGTLKTYTLLDESVTDPGDLKQRRVVERVVALRNRML